MLLSVLFMIYFQGFPIYELIPILKLVIVLGDASSKRVEVLVITNIIVFPFIFNS